MERLNILLVINMNVFIYLTKFDFGQCIVREENGKLITKSEKFTSVKEIQGDTLVEVSGLVINVVICLIIEIL